MAIARRYRRNLNFTGHAHELTFSCYQRLPFLRAERTCRWLLEDWSPRGKSFAFRFWPMSSCLNTCI